MSTLSLPALSIIEVSKGILKIREIREIRGLKTLYLGSFVKSDISLWHCGRVQSFRRNVFREKLKMRTPKLTNINPVILSKTSCPLASMSLPRACRRAVKFFT